MLRIALDLRSVHPGLTGIGRYALNLALSLEGRAAVLPITSVVGARYLAEHSRLVPLITDPRASSWKDTVLPDLLARLGADLYHTPILGNPAVAVCPAVCTIHDAIPRVRPDLCTPSFADLFRREIGSVQAGSAHVVTVSEHSRRDLIETVGLDPDRITAVPEPVSPFFSPSAREHALPTHFRFPGGFLLSVGALDRRKNLNALLDAMVLLLRRRAQLPRLLVVGGPSGDGYDLQAEIAHRSLQSHVIPLGRIDDVLLAQLYAHAIAFVFPSYYEGFGLPVVEAMASGTPVVATSASALPEVAGDAAMYADPLRPETFADAIARFLDDGPLREDFSQRGLKRAAEFSLKRQADRLVDLYERLASRAAA